MIDLNKYLEFVGEMSRYKYGEAPGFYPVLGLAGETGEVVEYFKKAARGDYELTDHLDKIQLELGDVFWYWTAIHRDLGLDPEVTIQKNMDKLIHRQKYGKPVG